MGEQTAEKRDAYPQLVKNLLPGSNCQSFQTTLSEQRKGRQGTLKANDVGSALFLCVF